MRPSPASRAPVSWGTNFGRLPTSDIAPYTASGGAATCSVCSCCISVPLFLRNAAPTLSLGRRRLLGERRDVDHRPTSRMKIDPGEDLDGDRGRRDPIDDHAEGGPPAGVRDEVSPVLPQVLEAMTR